jgi:hypothetical protein
MALFVGFICYLAGYVVGRWLKVKLSVSFDIPVESQPISQVQHSTIASLPKRPRGRPRKIPVVEKQPEFIWDFEQREILQK